MTLDGGILTAHRIAEALAQKGFDAGNGKADKLAEYARLLLEYNEKFNLTAITDAEGILYKHYIDSLEGLSALAGCRKIADIGTGAGLPAFPLKLFMPDAEFVLIDSLNKRIGFLEEVIKHLGLEKISFKHTRIEDAGREAGYRACFDAVTARAVAELNTLLEYAVPLLKVGGRLVAYKGSNVKEEVLNAKRALIELRCEITDIRQFDIAGAQRCILTVTKKSGTPDKYPRGGNKARISPI